MRMFDRSSVEKSLGKSTRASLCTKVRHQVVTAVPACVPRRQRSNTQYICTYGRLLFADHGGLHKLWSIAFTTSSSSPSYRRRYRYNNVTTARR